MANTKCVYCQSTNYGSGCRGSPIPSSYGTGIHVHPDDPERCRYCNSTSLGSGCRYAPGGKHSRGPGGKGCVYCGSTNYGSGCQNNPDGSGRHDHYGTNAAIQINAPEGSSREFNKTTSVGTSSTTDMGLESTGLIMIIGGAVIAIFLVISLLLTIALFPAIIMNYVMDRFIDNSQGWFYGYFTLLDKSRIDPLSWWVSGGTWSALIVLTLILHITKQRNSKVSKKQTE
jgi:hypothetical protein